jgi:hypothetical protein
MAAGVLAGVTLATGASAQDASPAPAVSAPVESKRHELALATITGVGWPMADTYEGIHELLLQAGVGAEYGYRITRHVRVGAEGTGSVVTTGERQRGHFFTGMPWLGLHFGGPSFELGLRAGFGVAQGGRVGVERNPDRTGWGTTWQLVAEATMVGESVDFFGRLGVRRTYTSWEHDPPNNMVPSDLPLTTVSLSLGARWKL